MKHFANTRTFCTLFSFFVVFFVTSNVWSMPADVANNGLFELDGNTTDDATAGDDGENVFNGTSSAGLAVFTADLINSNADDTFDGSNKDIQDITSWRWHQKSTLDKNDLANSFLAGYVDPATGHPVVYVGIDRYSAGGSDAFGWWLLKDQVTTAANGTFVDANTGLPAQHADGDILIVGTFQTTPTINIFQWDGATSSLVQISSAANDCATASSSGICGALNSSTQSVAWPYTGKSAPTNQHAPGAYLEVGIDLTEAFGNNVGCTASVMAVSRSSDSISATLKDFSLIDGASCDLVATKTGAQLSKEGDTVQFTFNIQNNGFIPLNITADTSDAFGIVDTELGDLTQTAIDNGCETLAGGDSCSFTVDWVVPAGYFTSNNPVVGDVVFTYAPPNGVADPNATASDSHTLWLFSPGVTVTKTGPAQAGHGQVISFDYTITNTSLNPPAASGLTAPDLVFTDPDGVADGFVNDSLLGDLTAAASSAGCDRIAQGASCVFSFNYTVDDANGDPQNTSVSVLYHPDGFPNQITASGNHALDIVILNVALNARTYLQSPLYGVDTSQVPLLMSDVLRAKGYLPTVEPYSAMPEFTHVNGGGGETVTDPGTVFADAGNDSIVDWVFFELRDPVDPTVVVTTHAALVQRDGDIVETDGSTLIVFQQTVPGSYYVAIRHRNHIGVMTKNPVPLTPTPTLVDFTDSSSDFWESAPQFDGVEQTLLGGKYVLWAGNANANGSVVFAGQDNDVNAIFNEVMGDSGNVFQSQVYIVPGANQGDIRFGDTVFAGQNNDVEPIFNNVDQHPLNVLRVLTFVIQEQLPK